MAFPVSPTEGQTYTENNTVWIYSSTAQQWFRSQVNPENETFYKFGGSASATGAAGEIQYTDGTNLAASPNLVWDNVNNELEVGGDVVLDDGGTFTTTLQTITPTANRTVSLPDASGTVALVAGSSGQITYNNAGANAGVSTFTADSSGRLTNSASSAASLPVKLWNGTIFAGTTPHVLIQPSTASAGSWSASGTALGVNTAAAFTGNLLDLQVNGSRRAAIDSTGVYGRPVSNVASVVDTFLIKDTTSNVGIGSYSGSNLVLSTNTNSSTNAGGVALSSTEFKLSNTHAICWVNGGGSLQTAADLFIRPDAANTLAQRNGTNAQTYRVYNTYTSSTNYELGKLEWNTNVFRIGTEKGSGGGTARTVEVHTDSIARLALDTTGSVRVVTGLTVATLPGTPAVGMIARVTDASAPAVGSTVVGGGAAAALVWYNGTDWRVIGV